MTESIYDQNLIDFCLDHKHKKAKTIEKSTMFETLLKATSWLDSQHPNTKDRIWMVSYNITKIPKCPICNNDNILSKDKGRHRFSKFCSEKCKDIFRSKLNPLLNDKSWLYEQRITKHRSYEEIARELDVRMPRLKLALERFNIPTENQKQKIFDEDILSIINNKDRLVDLYKNHTIKEMAKLIGVGHSCIIERLETLGIDRKANSYWSSRRGSLLTNSAKLLALHKTMTVVEISKLLHVTVDHVRGKITQYEIEEGLRGPKKNPGRSYGEISVFEYIISLIPEATHSNRSILNHKEIDILVESKKIGFEYNGLYYHSELNKDKDFHVNKTALAAEKGYTLFHIWEDDWVFNEKIWKSRIANLLGKTEHKIFARKTKIVELPAKEKNIFLDSNHLQGSDRSTWKYGLMNEGILVAVMTFSKSSKYNYTLSRFACLLNTAIVGGFSKLLAHFRKEHQGSIVSYADLSYSNGDVYKTNGFKEEAHYTGNYWYHSGGNTGKRIDRRNFQKDNLRKNFPNFDFKTNTELEMAHELGYYRVYGAGSKTFVLC